MARCGVDEPGASVICDVIAVEKGNHEIITEGRERMRTNPTRQICGPKIIKMFQSYF